MEIIQNFNQKETFVALFSALCLLVCLCVMHYKKYWATDEKRWLIEHSPKKIRREKIGIFIGELAFLYVCSHLSLLFYSDSWPGGFDYLRWALVALFGSMAMVLICLICWILTERFIKWYYYPVRSFDPRLPKINLKEYLNSKPTSNC